MRRPPLLPLLAALLTTSACSSAYYAAMYQLGWAKADLLANRVQQSRDAMDQAKIHFTEACQQFRPVPDEPAEETPTYQMLRASYGDDTANAALVRKRRTAVETAADALFGEWDAAITDSTDATQRRKRQQHYDEFRGPYDRLLDAMRAAEASMPPVLDGLQTQLAALQAGRAPSAINSADCDRVIRSLQLAIALADQYEAELENTE